MDTEEDQWTVTVDAHPLNVIHDHIKKAQEDESCADDVIKKGFTSRREGTLIIKLTAEKLNEGHVDEILRQFVAAIPKVYSYLEVKSVQADMEVSEIKTRNYTWSYAGAHLEKLKNRG